MFMEETSNLAISPDTSLDEVIASFSNSDKHAFSRLFFERSRLKVGWPEMLDMYAKTLDMTPLFSLSSEIAVDVHRIRLLKTLENRYGCISTYFLVPSQQ
jgi:hypothetical protein